MKEGKCTCIMYRICLYRGRPRLEAGLKHRPSQEPLEQRKLRPSLYSDKYDIIMCISGHAFVCM